MPLDWSGLQGALGGYRDIAKTIAQQKAMMGQTLREGLGGIGAQFAKRREAEKDRQLQRELPQIGAEANWDVRQQEIDVMATKEMERMVKEQGLTMETIGEQQKNEIELLGEELTTALTLKAQGVLDDQGFMERQADINTALQELIQGYGVTEGAKDRASREKIAAMGSVSDLTADAQQVWTDFIAVEGPARYGLEWNTPGWKEDNAEELRNVLETYIDLPNLNEGDKVNIMATFDAWLGAAGSSADAPVSVTGGARRGESGMLKQLGGGSTWDMIVSSVKNNAGRIWDFITRKDDDPSKLTGFEQGIPAYIDDPDSPGGPVKAPFTVEEQDVYGEFQDVRPLVPLGIQQIIDNVLEALGEPGYNINALAQYKDLLSIINQKLANEGE